MLVQLLSAEAAPGPTICALRSHVAVLLAGSGHRRGGGAGGFGPSARASIPASLSFSSIVTSRSGRIMRTCRHWPHVLRLTGIQPLALQWTQDIAIAPAGWNRTRI